MSKVKAQMPNQAQSSKKQISKQKLLKQNKKSAFNFTFGFCKFYLNFGF